MIEHRIPAKCFLLIYRVGSPTPLAYIMKISEFTLLLKDTSWQYVITLNQLCLMPIYSVLALEHLVEQVLNTLSHCNFPILKPLD